MALRPLFYDAIYKGEIRTLKCQIQFFNSQVPYLRSLGFFFISAETVYFPVSRHLGFDSACYTK